MAVRVMVDFSVLVVVRVRVKNQLGLPNTSN